ncbi:unnamed protein product [Adineta ricciae]|uniref:Cytochrome c oxidase assembly factor 3 mitochondrial coiled-coil domain-containing protein n=1 Tax=Adineta ricciae TaxID=249248 RepID=A0A815RP96_ADIRI|nr:unnamed protein product [Adineta ricciae]
MVSRRCRFIVKAQNIKLNPGYYGTVGSGRNPAARNLLESAKTMPEWRRAVPEPTQISTDPVAGMIDLDLPKIYTRIGDRGTSALLGSGSNRVSKESFGALVIAIYVYTILRVRQETFLDDFSIPEPPPQKKAVELD